MITTTISDFRKDIKRYLDSVTKNFETLIINRGKDPGVVIISLEESILREWKTRSIKVQI
jgi:antitoxin YefM